MCGEFGLANNFFGVRNHIVMFSWHLNIGNHKKRSLKIITVFENEEKGLRGLFLYLSKIVGHPIGLIWNLEFGIDWPRRRIYFCHLKLYFQNENK